MLFISKLIFISLCIALIFACSSSPNHHEPISKTTKKDITHKPKTQTAGYKIADLAKSLVGSPYKYGGETPNGFDCSGLVLYTHGKVGLQTPRTSLQQFRAAKTIPIKDLRNGDLIFFKLTRTRVSHVGIYVGNGRFIHAPQSGKQVKATHLNDDYWKTKIVSGGRLY
ncbi:MAG: C40 family peptidase [Gammaproteobacteria bacterium]